MTQYRLPDLEINGGNYTAKLLEKFPTLGVLFPSRTGSTKASYHAALLQMARAGVRNVIVDVDYNDLSPNDKISFVYMKPSAEDVPNVETIYLAGITPDDISKGAHSEDAARRLEKSPGIKLTLAAAIEACLR